MNFLFVCGGTAGHINPALAVASEIRRVLPDSRILFVGAGKELEKRLIPRAGFHLVNIRMSGLKRGFSPEELVYNVNTVRNLSTAGIKAEKLIRRFSPDAVIGTGGYICYPVMRKAAQLGIPTIVHESNAVPGLTTKLLSAYVDKVLISFPGLEDLYRRPDRVVFTGTPVRGGFETVPGEADAQKEREKPLVVSFWGSLGAEHMNELMTGFMKLNAERRLFDHIHAAGRSGGAAVMKNRLKQLLSSEELPECLEIREYIDDMQSVMASADLVMCRAGGSTLAEITVLGKPALLFPSPYVTNNQQLENAKQIQKAGGAIMIRENDCTVESLFELVSSLLGSPDKLKEMSQAQRSIGAPNATGDIVALILNGVPGNP